jgi:hypothetical protein
MEETKPKTAKKKVEPKRIKSPFEKVHDLFMEDFNDKELQERYENFIRTREGAKERHNAMVPEINALIQKGESLKETIVDLAVQGLSTEEPARLVRETVPQVKELRDKIAYQKGIMDSEDALIKKYKENSENKLFQYWKIFKALDPATAPWLDWRKPYSHHII